ncbi:MAG: glycosyltransferase family 39 protein, partial [Planctomycetota bacterium]
MNRNREGIQTSITVTLVVGLTFALRIAACRESFWLDELHSVWAISDGFGTVSERAGAGNQTASYFQLLWIWGRIFGSGEVALRASSVLVSCIAAAFLVVGVKKQSGSLAGGLVAGALFAIEPNSVFFGSELRPYAWVMLCGVLSLWSMMASVRSLEGNVERSHQGWHRFWMMFWLCAASLLHPTSLGTLGWFLPIVFLIPLLKRRLRWGRWDAFAFALLAVTGALLLRSSLTHAWQQREQWNSFAAARSIEQLLTIWQYVPLVVWPLVIAAAGYTCSSLQRVKIENEANDKPRGLGLLPMLVALAATTGFFIASYAEIVPLWHRRYFIVAVPLMAWSVGELIGWTNTVLRRNFLLGAALTCVCLIGQTFAFYRVGIGPSGWPIWRYENWRDAVTLVA